MLYCRNCGIETTKKICPGCGNKSKDGENYCGWCGNKVDKNAVKCPQCQEKLKAGRGEKFLKFVCIIAAIVFLFMGLSRISNDSVVTGILFVAAGLLLLPPVGNLIKNLTSGNKAVKKAFSVIRIIVVVIVAIICMVTPKDTYEGPTEYKVYDKDATEEAVEVFHQRVPLKNEESFVLNDSDVTVETPYEGDANKALVTVVLDYSAQNSFGGMNREEYTVKMRFDYTTGEYWALVE